MTEFNALTIKIAEKIAEYLALLTQLDVKSPPEFFRRANQLSWELAMILPEEIYLEIAIAATNSGTEHNHCTAIILARKAMLGVVAGKLSPDHIVGHSPKAGNKTSDN
jgi:hypothetical protein